MEETHEKPSKAGKRSEGDQWREKEDEGDGDGGVGMGRLEPQKRGQNEEFLTGRRKSLKGKGLGEEKRE